MTKKSTRGLVNDYLGIEGKVKQSTRKRKLTKQKLFLEIRTRVSSMATPELKSFSVRFTRNKWQPSASRPILPYKSTFQEMCKHMERYLILCKTIEQRLNRARCYVGLCLFKQVVQNCIQLVTWWTIYGYEQKTSWYYFWWSCFVYWRNRYECYRYNTGIPIVGLDQTLWCSLKRHQNNARDKNTEQTFQESSALTVWGVFSLQRMKRSDISIQSQHCRSYYNNG